MPRTTIHPRTFLSLIIYILIRLQLIMTVFSYRRILYHGGCATSYFIQHISDLKVPIAPLGILHIWNLWILLTEIVIYLFLLFINVNPGISFIVKTRSYRHTENISLRFEPNRIHDSFEYSKLPAVMRQIPRLTSLPSTSTAKKSTKITFSADKIYCNLFQEYPKIIHM